MHVTEPVQRDRRNLAKMLKPWLCSLTLGRYDTAVSEGKHVTNMFRSLEVGTKLPSSTETIPDELLLSKDGCEAIIG